MKKQVTTGLLLLLTSGMMGTTAFAQHKLISKAEKKAEEIEPQVIEWRHDFHQYPELSNRETKTAEKVAKHLKDLGMEVQTGIAHTGVVGILKGGKPGPVVALRADMDGLPVTETSDLAWASKEQGTYNGQEVGIMHACGHDTHISMLLGAAEILTSMKDDLKGTVKFIFQPAEEGAPKGEEGGARLMVKEGVLTEDPAPEVIFGLHINSSTEVGTLRYKPGGTMAAADRLQITVKGKQVHAAYPWNGIDPISVSAQIINGLQTIISRQTELINEAAVISIGSIHGGVRGNIIPSEVVMEGTIRTLDPEMQKKIHEKIELTATKIAESAGATAEVEFGDGIVTFNDPTLMDKMLPTLQAVTGPEKLVLSKATTGGEDFAAYQQEIPGLFLFVGGMPKGQDPATAPAHHTPEFYVDDSGMLLGIKTLTALTLDYMDNPMKK